MHMAIDWIIRIVIIIILTRMISKSIVRKFPSTSDCLDNIAMLVVSILMISAFSVFVLYSKHGLDVEFQQTAVYSVEQDSETFTLAEIVRNETSSIYVMKNNNQQLIAVELYSHSVSNCSTPTLTTEVRTSPHTIASVLVGARWTEYDTTYRLCFPLETKINRITLLP